MAGLKSMIFCNGVMLSMCHECTVDDAADVDDIDEDDQHEDDDCHAACTDEECIQIRCDLRCQDCAVASCGAKKS